MQRGLATTTWWR